MSEGENTVVFDPSTAGVGDGSAVMGASDFTPVGTDSEVTITSFPDVGATTIDSVPPEVAPSEGEAEDGFATTVKRGISFLQGFVPTDVNQRFDTFRAEQSNSMKPWKAFIGHPNFAASYGFVMPQYIPPRFMSNLKSYLWNYVALVGITFAFISLFNFPFFLVALALIALWLYVFFWRSGPMVIFSQTLPSKFVAIGLAILSILVCWLVLGNDFWILILCDVVVCWGLEGGGFVEIGI